MTSHTKTLKIRVKDKHAKAFNQGLIRTPLLLSVVCGLIFSLVFYAAYFFIDGISYTARDDGVITMSHARNWVEHGFIGVGPSGARLEGCSAPVQMKIYAALYALFEIGYETYANLQTTICTFLLGALFFLFFKTRPILGVILSTLAALLLSTQSAFLLWHGSGMENAITHVLFLARLLILFSFCIQEKIHFGWSLIVFLATISRIESVYHIAPVLAIFSFFLR